MKELCNIDSTLYAFSEIFPSQEPETKFENGIVKTIQWYLDHKDWWEEIISGEYQNYYDKMYGEK